MSFVNNDLMYRETERLRLRLPTERDFDTWAMWMADPGTMKYLGTGAVLPRDEAWRSLAVLLGHWQLRGYGMWVMEEKATGKLVGRGGLLNPEGWPGIEVGWLVAPEARGRGFATELAHCAVDLAFSRLGCAEVYSIILPENLPSIRVAERIGSMYSRPGKVRGLDVAFYTVTPRTWRRP